MKTAQGPLKKQLEDNIELLKKPSISSNALYALSWSGLAVAVPSRIVKRAMEWASPLVTGSYQRMVPQRAQDVVAKAQGAIEPYTRTMDSQCKTDLKHLAEEQVKLLHSEHKYFERKLDALSTKIAQGNSAFKELIDDESSENLGQIVTANEAAVGALDSYVKAATEVREQREKLMKFKGSSAQLGDFIKQNDGVLVLLSNLFSRLSALFKTDTAKMIDEARALQNQMDSLAKACEESTEKALEKMQATN